MPAMTTSDPSPIVQRILLGARLREARQATGLNTSDATKALGWHTGKLSRVEQGDVPLSDKDLARAIKVLQIEPEQAGQLQRLATEARRKLPPTRIAEWAARYVHLVAAASELKIWNSDTWPGTVQTEEYARATLRHVVTVAPADVDRIAEDRAKRVERLKTDDAPRLWLIVGEEAVHRTVGDDRVLRDQLTRVLELSALPNVTIQVFPLDGGAHSSHGVSFSIVSLIEGREGVVYLGGLTGSDYLGADHVRVYNLAFDNLRVAALSPQQTMDVIKRRITELQGGA
jgi:transcriptional regulator with XRE-family HTH domain